MRSTFSVLFYLNTSKQKKSGCCPVMGRITVDGSIAAFSLKKDIHPDLWDAQAGKAKGKTREQIELNKLISQTEQNIKDIYERTIETVGFVTAEHIKNELTGVTAKAATLLQLFWEHNEEYKKRVGIDRTAKTYANYENAYGHLSAFIRSKYDLEDYPLKHLDMSFINGYDYYLRVYAKLATNSIIYQIAYLKKMIARAIRQGTLLRDPFKEYVRDKPQRQYRNLSGDELESLLKIKIDVPKLCFVRDMFVFSCFTGLAYADMCHLSEKHLRKSSDGNLWLDIPRQKTGVSSNIKLLNIPLKIMEKYRLERKSEKLFNMPSNSFISNYMRDLEQLCGIRRLHFHMARHTFATLICLTHGVPIETISKALGHSDLRSTQIYAEITNQKVGNDMKKGAVRMKGKFKMN